MHLAGVIGEAEAECLAAQIDALVAAGLGASPTFARSVAREYWAYYYPSQDRLYRSPNCRDGGALDLFPDRRGWPTPAAAYSPTLAFRIESLVAAIRSTDGSR